MDLFQATANMPISHKFLTKVVLKKVIKFGKVQSWGYVNFLRQFLQFSNCYLKTSQCEIFDSYLFSCKFLFTNSKDIISIKCTVMQTEKFLMNDFLPALSVSKDGYSKINFRILHAKYLLFCKYSLAKIAIFLKDASFLTCCIVLFFFDF